MIFALWNVVLEGFTFNGIFEFPYEIPFGGELIRFDIASADYQVDARFLDVADYY